MEWIKAQIEWLKSIFSEASGKASIKRLIMFIITIAFLHAYTRIAVDSKELVDIPQNWSFLLAGILGLGILGNHVNQQKKGE